MQTRLVKIFTNTLSESLNTSVSISNVDFSFFNRLILKDVYVADQKGDTLLYVKKLSADITYFNYKKRKINISTLSFQNPKAIIRKYKEGLNIMFLVNALNEREGGEAWDINIGEILSKDGLSAYKFENPVSREYGINYQDILITDFNFEIDQIQLGDTTSFYIRSMNFNEKSGARINDINTYTYLSKGRIHFVDLITTFQKSTINANFLDIYYNNINDFKDYYHKLKIDTDLKRSNLSFTDIAYFNSTVRGLNEMLFVKGKFKGKLSDIRAKEIEIYYNSDTKLTGSFSLVGLPNVKKSFIYADITEFTTSKYDIEAFKLPTRWLSKPIKLTDNFSDIGRIKYTGNLTGFLNDFVAYGILQTDYGLISTDLGIKKNGKLDYEFRGDIHTEKFNPENFAGLNSLIKETNLNLKINGQYNKKGLLAKVEGIIDSIDINNYIYHNVAVDGLFTDKKFDGLVNIFDENIELEFSGRFDFSSEIPEYKFSSVVSNAQLDKLNIYDGDSLPRLSFTMESNLIGSDPDNLKGEVILWDTKYETSDNTIIMNEFYLTANQEDTINSFIVNSSLADIEIIGNYKFSTLKVSLVNYFHTQFPSFSHNPMQVESHDSLSFKVYIKDINPICKSFFSLIEIEPSSTISGNFSSITNNLNAKLNLPGLKISDIYFDTLQAELNTQNTLMNITANSYDVTYRDLSILPDLDITANSFVDSIDFNLNWKNDDSISYKGEIITQVTFNKSESKLPEITINLNPTEIVIADSVWNLSSGKIVNDSSYFSFMNFNFHNDYQHLFLNGEVSQDPEDTLFIKIKDLPLANFNRITKLNKYFFFEGNINGESSLTNIYNDAIFSSDLSINDFSINGKNIGYTEVQSVWDNINKQLNISAFAQRGHVKPFKLSGYYIPMNKNIDFDVVLDKFHVSVFHSFIENYVSDLNGIISDNLKITGTTYKPIIDGELKLQKVSFLFDYLNVRYNFSDVIKIENNEFFLDDIDLYDSQGEKGNINGKITNEYFKNLIFDININANNMTFLNTREVNNSLYYGNAFATGLIDIKGDLKNIEININARTEKDTRFFIPLDSEYEIEDNNFISFVNATIDEDIISENVTEAIDLSGIQLNFELEVTPDAEVQLIFNSKVGDIIKGYGNANLKLEINTQGQFNMFGEYIIDKGEYLFVLANFMSKKFKVKSGGTINWDGDPYDANINLETYYSVNTSLQELYMDTSEAYTKTIPVECQIFMTEKLMNPEFDFAIDLPKSGETEKAQLNSLPTDELNKQFISLLFINRFQPLLGLNVSGEATASNYSLSESTSELLSNQLSHWLSQISNDFDIGFKYRNGDEISTSQVEFALETQLFNDRLRINGNVGYGGQYARTNSIVGDVEADLKLNSSGKVRIKAFSKSNTNFNYDKGPTTQGLGLFYREEFDSFNNLLRKYFKKSTIK